LKILPCNCQCQTAQQNGKIIQLPQTPWPTNKGCKVEDQFPIQLHPFQLPKHLTEDKHLSIREVGLRRSNIEYDRSAAEVSLKTKQDFEAHFRASQNTLKELQY
jgi:hypothetical protein